MRYRLSALVIMVALGPPILAGVWQFEADSWPLFLALGVAAYFVFTLALGTAIAWLLETTARVIARIARERSGRFAALAKRERLRCGRRPSQGTGP